MAECPTCGNSFDTERGMKYHHAVVHGESITDEEYTCTWCGSTFERHPSSMTESEKQFCSDDCMGSWIENKQDPEDAPHWDGGPDALVCESCGGTFHRPPSQQTDSNREFCSPSCWGTWIEDEQDIEDHPHWNGGDVEVDCHWCSETVTRRPAAVANQERIFCSANYHGAWRSEHRTGEDAFNWRGGHESYYGPTWHPQRRATLERDDYECQDCGMTREEHYEAHDRDLEVHHITPFRTFSDSAKANQLDNLITLCMSCHQKHEQTDEELIAV